MKILPLLIIVLFGLSTMTQARYMNVEAVISKQGDNFVVMHRSVDKPISIEAFTLYLRELENNSVIGLKIFSTESVPIATIQTILTAASHNPLIELLEIRLNSPGKRGLGQEQEGTLEEQIDNLIDPVLKELRDETEPTEKKQNKSEMATPRKPSDQIELPTGAPFL